VVALASLPHRQSASARFGASALLLRVADRRIQERDERDLGRLVLVLRGRVGPDDWRARFGREAAGRLACAGYHRRVLAVLTFLRAHDTAARRDADA
jgi:hypothetical protein